LNKQELSIGALPDPTLRRGRSLDQRLDLGRHNVDICAEVLNVPKRTVVEFIHTGDEILREGGWANDRTPAEASGREPSIPWISA
jgi:hypothetical protein